MLLEQDSRYKLTDFDRAVFSEVVPRGHRLRRALDSIQWDAFSEELAGFYSAEHGQPAIKPLLMFKLEYLRYLCRLSDRQVIDRAETDISFRFFLQVGTKFRLPDPSTLCRFRGRIGHEGFHRLFQVLVGQARKAGLIKDRLRLKDATHTIANIAIPTTRGLLAQIRDRLLAAAEPFDPESAAGHRIETNLIRDRTTDQDPAMKLEARVIHLREILAWAEQLPTPEAGDRDRNWQQLCKLRELAAKILYDQDHPEAKRRTRSVVDPEAMRGKHGDWYDGYTLDILMDADSEIVTELNVMEAGGNEAKDAVELVSREQEAHGNDIETLSIDGAGFNGEMIRACEDPEGLNVEVIVPPKKEKNDGRFDVTEFVMSEDESTVTCPAGEQSKYRQKCDRKNGWIFRFTRQQCDDCPLVQQCMAHPGQGKFGKVVRKNKYEQEYQRVRQRALTDKFALVRKEHPAIERKINDITNHQRGRRARYWGRHKVLIQQYMTCFAVNVKRILLLLQAEQPAVT